MKIVYDKVKGSLNIEGLRSVHIEVLSAVMQLVRLDHEGYGLAAAELVTMLDKAGYCIEVDAYCNYNNEVVLL